MALRRLPNLRPAQSRVPCRLPSCRPRGGAPASAPWSLAARSLHATRVVLDAAPDTAQPDKSAPDSPQSLASRIRQLTVGPLDTFSRRHIGPDDAETVQMLAELSPPAESMDQFIDQVIPASIRSASPDLLDKETRLAASTEGEVASQAKFWSKQNVSRRVYIGGGYSPCITPAVIRRNVLENPAWYTSYTPYQPEISQGRLECLVNFQTMVADLTSLPIANASLLDEGTAAAEAMTVSLNVLPASRAKRAGRTFVVSDRVHPATISVMRSRADGFGLQLDVVDLSTTANALEHIRSRAADLVGVLVQYPDTHGQVYDFRQLADAVHEAGALFSVATDLLALTTLTPPGEFGADIAVGSAQRFGIPMGFGGPHAAFFATKDSLKRKVPGRLIGMSKDRLGNRAYRLALQTREQHIRREKATSNVCTAQALLANMSALYAVYHGPQGLRAQAEKVTRWARFVQAAAEFYGIETQGGGGAGHRVPFDTVVLRLGPKRAERFIQKAQRRRLLFGHIPDEHSVRISLHERVTPSAMIAMLDVLRALATKNQEVPTENAFDKCVDLLGGFDQPLELPAAFRRTTPYLTHPVFNTHHSETEMLRYIHHLQSKDLSLVHSMIPLGSCTMKLNGTTEMELMALPGFANQHPLAPDTDGYGKLVGHLSKQLAAITGLPSVSLQPNSGAQGEFAGLRVIRKYHEARPGPKRDICLIPVSAHGTNPASAAMAGMRVVPIKCDAKTSYLDMADLEAKCRAHADELGAIMITYPSTFGIFEPDIKRACDLVHEHGGLVYMDGANMNGQIGLCSPGEIGADVCHLNLHKTFCIPHGGGGPGVGPICVREDLAQYLPGHSPRGAEQHMVSSATYGSASILPISWAYNRLMGSTGLRQATRVTLLNANYLLGRLRPHYKILYTNEHGRCAHEFILDVRPFRESAGIEAIDIAKRLQDYSFHAPTMSWPVAGTLMIEPTESESKDELDRFVAALVAIRGEIRDIEDGHQPREGNVLKMAPHPQADLVDGDGGGRWERPYSREKAAYPLPWLREKKFWPTVARVDDAYGDMNLFCTCPPVEDTTGVAEEGSEA